MATSELVERTTYEAYGNTESDYRPGRWKNFHEDYKFTGKEEDIEVGLQFFGYRYYAPALNRWISADPLTIHGLGADLNAYAYVNGHVLKATDPLGLCPKNTSCEDVVQHQDGSIEDSSGDKRRPSHDRGKELTVNIRPRSPWKWYPNAREMEGVGFGFGLTKGVAPFGFVVPPPPNVADSPAFVSGMKKGELVGALASLRGGLKAPTGGGGTGALVLGGKFGNGIAALRTVTANPGLILNGGGWMVAISFMTSWKGDGGSKSVPKPSNYSSSWKPGPNDKDWRGTGKTAQEAVNEAFQKTGVPREQFQVTKWGKG
jgi:RHS repeat-associated protein